MTSETSWQTDEDWTDSKLHDRFPSFFSADVVHDPPDPDLHRQCINYISHRLDRKTTTSLLNKAIINDTGEARLSLMVQFLTKTPGFAIVPLAEDTPGYASFVAELKDLGLTALPRLPQGPQIAISGSLPSHGPSLLIHRKMNLSSLVDSAPGVRGLGSVFDATGLEPLK